VVTANEPGVLGVGRWFIQVGSPRPFCVEFSSSEPAKKLGEVAVGSKSYGGDCHHAPYSNHLSSLTMATPFRASKAALVK
jgi:hypothetical protein